MIDYLTFVRCMEKRGAKVLPKELSGLTLALFLREHPDKLYWRGDTLFTYDTVNNSYLWCNPFNKKQKWWYRANGLNSDYNHYFWKMSNARLYQNQFHEQVKNAEEQELLPL